MVARGRPSLTNIMEKAQRGFCDTTKYILFNDNNYLLTELKETTKHTPPHQILVQSPQLPTNWLSLCVLALSTSVTHCYVLWSRNCIFSINTSKRKEKKSRINHTAAFFFFGSNLTAPFQKYPGADSSSSSSQHIPRSLQPFPSSISHLFWQRQGLHSTPLPALIHTHRHPHGPVFNQPSISAQQTCICTHTHTHTFGTLNLLPYAPPSIHPSIIHPSILPPLPPAVFADAITADWFICDFPAAPSQTHTHTQKKKILANRRDSFVMITLNWFPDFLHSVATGGRRERGDRQKGGERERDGREGFNQVPFSWCVTVKTTRTRKNCRSDGADTGGNQQKADVSAQSSQPDWEMGNKTNPEKWRKRREGIQGEGR